MSFADISAIPLSANGTHESRCLYQERLPTAEQTSPAGMGQTSTPENPVLGAEYLQEVRQLRVAVGDVGILSRQRRKYITQTAQ